MIIERCTIASSSRAPDVGTTGPVPDMPRALHHGSADDGTQILTVSRPDSWPLAGASPPLAALLGDLCRGQHQAEGDFSPVPDPHLHASWLTGRSRRELPAMWGVTLSVGRVAGVVGLFAHCGHGCVAQVQAVHVRPDVYGRDGAECLEPVEQPEQEEQERGV